MTIEDLIEFGLIPELASRITRIINTHPLTVDDYRYLITKHPASPIKKLEITYGMSMGLSKKKIDVIVKNAYDSGLGVRNVTSQLQQMMDEKIFDNFLKEESHEI